MSRPRGFAHWNAQPDSLALIDQVKEILRDQAAYLPLTARQIFYMLVGQYDYEKTEKAYSNLANKIVLARRAQMIPFGSIRDDGPKASGWSGNGYESPFAFWESLRESGDTYYVKRHEGQPCRVELWCEAAGMVPMLSRVAGEFDVVTYSAGGFPSVTVTHDIAQRAARAEMPTVLIHLGDFDPSGESIFESSMQADVEAFCYSLGADFTAKRIALTSEQVDDYNLETAPPKSTDSRSANWVGETAQLEAMQPADITALVRDAIAAELDLELRDSVLAREEHERATIIERLEEVMQDFE